MKRLTICAYGAFILISTSAVAQDMQTGSTGAESAPVLLGQDKVAPLCPEFCALRRVTSPELASGGERDAEVVRRHILDMIATEPLVSTPDYVAIVDAADLEPLERLAYTLAAAATGTKLHVDSRRSAWAQAEKFPTTASSETPLNMVTQNEFRPALDPVLAEPTTNNTE